MSNIKVDDEVKVTATHILEPLRGPLTAEEFCPEYKVKVCGRRYEYSRPAWEVTWTDIHGKRWYGIIYEGEFEKV